MTKITVLLLLATCLVVTFTPEAQAQACRPFDPHGRVGVHEGRPYAHYTILDCAMTPIILHLGAKEAGP